MTSTRSSSVLFRLASDYGMLVVLALIGGWYSWATYGEQHETGGVAGSQVAAELLRQLERDANVLIVTRVSREDDEFARELERELTTGGLHVLQVVQGEPRDARQALVGLAERGQRLHAIGATHDTVGWAVLEGLSEKHPRLGEVVVQAPQVYSWPSFLTRTNLLNIANQISVIAILSVGMTLVMITGGIDLSVGSLIALSAVCATRLIRDLGGAESAGTMAMLLSCAGSIALCGLVGLLSGVTVSQLAIRPFIVTLSFLYVASGLAYIVAEGQSVYQVPDSFVWLGRGAEILGIPNAVVLTMVLYGVAHFVMGSTRLGRHIYAVGGNAEAARLAGVNVRGIVMFVYALSGALAGLGGVVMASQLKSGAPNYGQEYELNVIAAVVVGGTSLNGGEGKILGTLIGALIIAVIRNGMNLTGVESFRQKVVLGLVILGAVLLDMGKRRAWDALLARRRRSLTSKPERS